MSVQKNSSILASDLNSIKTSIANELSRRNKTATSVSFTKDNQISVNQINTLINNLKIIDSSSWISSKEAGTLVHSDEWNTLSTKVAALAALTGKGSASGCSSGCMGLCQGCTGNCTGSCSGSCSGGCSGCGGNCSGGCTGCGSGCASGCSGGCKTGCGGYCLSGDCTGTCFSGAVQSTPGCSGGYA